MGSPTFGYAGVTTHDPTLQIDALTAGGYARVMVETASAARAGQRGLARLLEQWRSGAVWGL